MIVREVLHHRALGLSLLTTGFDDANVVWSHSSDLDDPSPFLEPGHLLLTTGTQFSHYDTGEQFEAYAGRLVAAGVVALGFGTEVVRRGTPAELIAACEASGLALLEVPYATPFIAVSKYIADTIAGETRRRLEWTLAAQDGISKAVLGSGGLAAAIQSASSALDCSIAVLDPDGGVLEGAALPTLRRRAVGLLERRQRALDVADDGDGAWVIQTLGASGRLVGALVLQRESALRADEFSIVSMLTALTELALEHAEDQRLGFRSVSRQLLGLLLDGKAGAVQEALTYYPIQLPSEPFRVISIAVAHLDATVRDSLERMSASRRHRSFPVQYHDHLLMFVDATSNDEVQQRLADAGVRGGLSSDAQWATVGDAIAEADAALAGAPLGKLLSFDDLMAGTLLGLLNEKGVADLARLRLGRLPDSSEGRAQLIEGATWLRWNGAWEPAARELNLHRHTLKMRIAALGRELNLSLDEFQGRAELWAMLAALDLHDLNRTPAVTHETSSHPPNPDAAIAR